MSNREIVDKIYDKIINGALKIVYYHDDYPPSYGIVNNEHVQVGFLERWNDEYILTINRLKFDLSSEEYYLLKSTYRKPNRQDDIDKTLTFLDNIRGE